MKIYNSLTRKKEEFIPIKKGKVGMYVCGPTVYDESHIGHARSAYMFDIIRRYLEHKGFDVKFVRNVTDVDDKIIEKARAVAQAGLKEKVLEISRKCLDSYHEDMDLLGIGRPDNEPKATEYIPKMIKFIQLLIKRECAYEADGDVYFDIKSVKDYGKLSNQNLEKMESGARIAPDEKKKDPLDFALWKRAKALEPSWPSPWGEGRPGWHIECSVMSSDILGDEFDIHGGGIDLIFPHHENEIVQSEGAGKKFAKAWMHNGLLTIKGEKMAKSLGNFVTIKDFVARHKNADYLKLFFLSAHYTSPIDYTEERIAEAKKERERFLIFLEKSGKVIGDRLSSIGDRVKKARKKTTNDEFEEFRRQFEEAMDDDFNTPLALASLFDLVTYANKFMHEKSDYADEEKAKLKYIRDELLALSRIFGLELSSDAAGKEIDEEKIVKMISERDAARKNMDFKKADDIRKKLSDMNIIIEDTKGGTQWRIKA